MKITVPKVKFKVSKLLKFFKLKNISFLSSMNISTKLVLVNSILVLLICTLLTSAVSVVLSHSIKENGKVDLSKKAEDVALLIEERLSSLRNQAQSIADRTVIKSMDWEQQLPLLKKIIKENGYVDIGIIDETMLAHYTDGSRDLIGFNDYINQAREGETTITDVIIDNVTNSPIFFVSTPILDENDLEVLGILTIKIGASYINSLTEDVVFGETGYAYIVNKYSVTITHPNLDYILNRFSITNNASKDPEYLDLANQMRYITSGVTGHGSYSYQDENYLLGYTPIVSQDWYLVLTVPEDELLGILLQLQSHIIVLCVITLTIGILIAYKLGILISAPIKSISQNAIDIANLDLSTKLNEKYLKREDEIGILAISFQTLIDSLKGFAVNIINTSEHVALSSQKLNIISEEASSSSECMSKAIEELASTATNQAQSTEEGVTNIEDLSDKIDQAILGNGSITIISQKAEKKKDEGLSIVNDLTEKTRQTRKSFDLVSKKIDESQRSIEKITKFNETIKNIADQTNLLSLNAAIEAARVGEVGQGFSVVSEEMRKLATQSAQASKEINLLVNSIKSNSQENIKIMDFVSETVTIQESTVKSTKNIFNELAKLVVDLQYQTQMTNEYCTSMNNRKNGILRVMEAIAEGSKESAASTEETSASIQELTAFIIELSNSSHELTLLAQSLKDDISRFKTE